MVVQIIIDIAIVIMFLWGICRLYLYMKHLYLLVELQHKEVERLRNIIKDNETDAIVQLRGSAQHADKEIKGIKKDITERLNMLWEALETTSKILDEKINETNKGQNDEQNKME